MQSNCSEHRDTRVFHQHADTQTVDRYGQSESEPPAASSDSVEACNSDLPWPEMAQQVKIQPSLRQARMILRLSLRKSRIDEIY